MIAGSTAMLPGPSIAATDGSPYLGMQYAITDVIPGNVSDEFNPTTLVALGGKSLYRNFAVEGRFAIPLKDDTKSVSGTETSVGLFSIAGLYGVGQVKLGNRLGLYALAGLSYVKYDIKTPRSTNSISDTGVSYGLGADIGTGYGDLAFNIEYMVYLDKSGIEVNALALGFKLVF